MIDLKPPMIALFALVLVAYPSMADARQDSVQQAYHQLLQAKLEPSARVDALTEFAREHLATQDSLAQLALLEAIGIAQASQDVFGEGIARYWLARNEERHGNIRTALRYAQESIQVLERERASKPLVQAYLFAGWVSRRLMESGKSMEYCTIGLRLAEQLRDTANIGSGYNHIAALYVGMQDYEKALDYHRQALHWRQLAKDTIAMALSHGNMGIVYMRLKRYEDALAAHKRGVQVVRKAGQLSHEAFFYNDIGSTFLYKGDTDSAIHYLKKSVAMREDMNETNEIAYTYNYLGEAYEQAGNLADGERWIKRALQTAIDIQNSKQHYEALESLSDFYARNGRHDSAYVYLRAHKVYGDSISESRRAALIDELAAQYETEKKEQRIELLSQETAIQRLRLRQRGLYLLAALGVLVAGGVTVYFMLKQRRLRADARLQQAVSQQQEQATRAVLDAEERERRRIAGDLHDGVGQLLSSALINLGYVNKDMQRGVLPDHEAMGNAVQLVKDSYDEMRSISHQMMPNALLKAGLASSVKEFLDKIDGKKLKVHLEVVGLDERLEAQAETVLYRAIQESVNNVVKHSEASKLTIQLVKDASGISVTIEDNGRGFPPGTIENATGIGLRNMRSRVALLNGTVDVDSNPGAGTLVVIIIPAA